MDLCRKILFAIEDEYIDTAVYNLKIHGYDMPQIAYHCNLLYQAGLINDYDANYGGDHICSFGVGSLTWNGHDFLDKIREDGFWDKIKAGIAKNALPMTLGVIQASVNAAVSMAMKSVFGTASE